MLMLTLVETAPELVAMGTFMNPDTTRIIVKRLIITGHPFKVHKKTATVRYMFFNPGEPFYLVLSFFTLTERRWDKTTYSITSLSSCTRNTGGLDISGSRLVRMDTSRRTLMGRSTRWTRCACLCISVCIRDGARLG
jgi:hypothetical protein